jgi:predicted amidohydrolase
VKASVVIAQVPIVWDIEKNLAMVNKVLAQTRPDDVVVLPEGALSGYGADLSPLGTLDHAMLAQAIKAVADLARQKVIHVFCGSLLFDHGAWWNAALSFSPLGDHRIYRKINLAMNERDHLSAGSHLPVLAVRQTTGEFTAGVQICREIRFPEQWQHLARSGADVFIYLTNAVNTREPAGVWRSHLISRAAENQRFLLAANVADVHQHCPSMAISPWRNRYDAGGIEALHHLGHEHR